MRKDEPIVSIEVGDLVKAYDFETSDDCFMVGMVTGFREVEGCQRYCINVEHRIWEGKRLGKGETPDVTFPPVNGTMHILDSVCNGVRKV